MKLSHYSILAATICVSLFAIRPASAAGVECNALLQQHLSTDLSLQFPDFDQDDAKGWRLLSASGCEGEVATLIERYISIHEHPHPVLFWHRTQALAKAGSYPQAIQAARETLRPQEEEDHGKFKWNAYVNATIAFLQGDRELLRQPEEELVVAASVEPMNQPNLRSVQRLQRCFGKPYKDAYTCTAGP